MARDSRPILIIDDDRRSALTLEAALKEGGYATVTTSDPARALDIVRQLRPSLVILDLDLENADGFELLGLLRESGAARIIAVASTDSSEIAVRSLKIGAQDFLTQPIDVAKLLRIVSTAWNSESDLGSRRIAHYELRREIGRGGMGIVYEARDRVLDRLAAVKVLLPALAADPDFELRFLREARAAARLSHPGLVTVFEAGRDRGRLYIAMELIRGNTLAELRDSGTRFSPGEAVDIILHAAEAMDVAHSGGLIHRDIKPANLMLTPRSTVKVLDFGLVRSVSADRTPLTKLGTVVGTPGYVAPEMIRGEPIDVRCDIYSLGIVFYELLINDDAFDADRWYTLLSKIVQGCIKRPIHEIESVPPELRRIVRRMTAVRPDDRPSSLREIIPALRRLQVELHVKDSLGLH